MDFRTSTFKQFIPYVPGEQPQEQGWIKLNTNELAYSPSPRALLELKKIGEFPNLLRQYSDPFGEPLRSKLAEFYELNANQVLITNGSDEALSLVTRTFLEPDESVSFPKITYSLYKTLLQVANRNFEEIDLIDNISFQVDLVALENSNAKIIFLPNPNAPTAEYIDTSILKEIIKNSKKLWVIDEAYNDFVETENSSMTSFLSELSNLIVVRTFSKSYGLAGMRLGYALSSNKYVMQGLYSTKDSYNVDAIAARVGLAAWQDSNYWQQCIDKVIEQRKFLTQKLQELQFSVLSSETNFLLVSPQHSFSAKQILEQLRDFKILVRHFATFELNNFLRITIGSQEENQILINSLKKILQVEK